jgi:polar amino acid transport system substrate-binding protein
VLHARNWGKALAMPALPAMRHLATLPSRRNVGALTLFSLLAIVSEGCRKDTAKPAAPALRVGMDLSYPPFEMQDTAGKPDGVSVKLAEALATKLRRPLQLVPMDFSGLIPALKTGNIDIILSSMTATDERRRSIAFSNPYAFTGLALLVRKGSNIQSVADLKNGPHSITAKAATTGETWAVKNLPDAKRVVFEDAAACVAEVVQGRADAFLYDQLSIYKYAEQNKATTEPRLKAFVEEAWAIGVAQDNAALTSDVNAFLDEYRTSGGLQKLGEQYLGAEKKAMDAAGIPFLLR